MARSRKRGKIPKVADKLIIVSNARSIYSVRIRNIIRVNMPWSDARDAHTQKNKKGRPNLTHMRKSDLVSTGDY